MKCGAARWFAIGVGVATAAGVVGVVIAALGRRRQVAGQAASEAGAQVPVTEIAPQPVG